MMKNLWVIALLGVGIFVSDCNAACFQIAARGQRKRDPGGCIYKGVVHEYGSRWRTEDCHDCDCNANGSMTCCQAYGIPVSYDKEKCIALWEQGACTYHVISKDKLKEPCDQAMVG